MAHEHNHSLSQKKMGAAIALNAVIFLVEITAGLLTNSLALVSDALHNLSDFFSLILSYLGAKVTLWDSNHKKTYGYVRVEIFVAFINSVSLVIIGGFIIFEAFKRLSDPEPVIGLWMLLAAVTGFVANVLATLLLRNEAEHDLNSKSAYLHLLTDAVESLAVIIIGGLIYWLNWNILDPIISVIIGIFIIKSAWNVVMEAVNILTEGTPKGIDVKEVVKVISSLPEVISIHHLHVWSLSSNIKALSAHVVIKDTLISEGNDVINRIGEELEHKFKINHPTIQLESCECENQGIVVNPNNLK
ncbi:MAG TPA: cation diffusion facilitator family transporter [Ignavibacteriales bacterium]|nr:cation diffusion facilitator family transporter [Ignavibacteriales bacterium]